MVRHDHSVLENRIATAERRFFFSFDQYYQIMDLEV